MVIDTEVFIIGAGPAGLTAAYCLAKEQKTAVIVESDSVYVGGISKTVAYKGYSFDIGGHRFFSKSKEIVGLWKEILPDDFIERPRQSRIFYRGQYYSYPLRAFEALSNLGIANSAACLFSFFYAKCFPIKEPRSFHDWVRNQFGERLFSIFFKTYTEKVWGMSCNEISADWAAQRIKGLSLSVAVIDALKRALLPKWLNKASDQVTAKTLIESFQYPRKGPGMMWEAAARKIVHSGGKIVMGRQATKLTYDPRQHMWNIEVRGPAGIEYYTARDVISSAPIAEVVGSISPTPDCLPHARKLRYRDFLTVALIVKRSDVFSDNWIYIHDPSVKVGRIQNFRSWSPEMVVPGTTCLGLEYFCFEGDGLWNAPDVELIELAKTEISKIGLVAVEDITDACVVRQAKAYPVYDDDYQTHVSAIRRDLEISFPTLHLVGRNGMHKYNNQDHAMMTSMLTVRNIMAGKRLYDVWQVNEDAEYHESGVSGGREALRSERLVPRQLRRRPKRA